MKKMIADYMESGFLESIIDMFKHDKSLYLILGDIIEDERGRVRLGAVALVEHLKATHFDYIPAAIPGIIKALKNPNPTIRGDAAYLLGIIGHSDALSSLSDAYNNKDEHEVVRETIRESMGIINQNNGL